MLACIFGRMTGRALALAVCRAERLPENSLRPIAVLDARSLAAEERYLVHGDTGNMIPLLRGGFA
jgi:hypothetical protein